MSAPPPLHHIHGEILQMLSRQRGILPVKVQGSLAYEPVPAAHGPLLTTHPYPNEV